MGALSVDEVMRCSLCRGYGWRFVSSRMVASVRAFDGGEEPLPRRVCAGCAGSGFTEGLATGSLVEVSLGANGGGRGVGR